MSDKIDVVMVTQAELNRLAQEPRAVRAGATTDLESRQAAYAQEGYSGTMYAARTQNMERAENSLLGVREFRHNQQQSSNAPEEPGYVYLIQGRKSSR